MSSMSNFPVMFSGAGAPPEPPPDPGGGTKLPAPYSFDAAKAGTAQINLTWNNDVNASSYKIWWKGVGGTFALLATKAAGTTSHAHTGLAPNTMIYYRFQSIGDGVDWADSDYVYRNDVTDDTLSGLAKVASTALDSKSATSTNRSNVQTFMQSLAAADCDENIVCAYFLYMGANFLERYLNILCPEDNDDSFRASTVGTNAALDAKGVKSVAAGYFVDFKVMPNEIVERPMIGFSFYLQSAEIQAVNNGNPELNIIHFLVNSTPPPTNLSLPNIGVNSGGTAWTGTNLPGHTMLHRLDWDHVKVYQNGALKADDTAQHIAEITANETPSNYFSQNSPKLYIGGAGKICSMFFVLHEFETDAKVTAFNNAVAAFATAEGFNA